MLISNKYYSIVKTGTDDYKLTIKATKREIDFKRDVNFMKKIQSCNAKGRILMIKQLKESGLTKDDLIERRETTDENGKVVVIYDDSMFRYMEQECIKDATGQVMLDLMNETLKEGIDSIVAEMNIDPTEEKEFAKKFGEDFSNCMLNRVDTEETPRTVARKKAK